jgi:long-chain acyl-CoA synthetase
MADRPWLRHYDAGIPASLAPYPDTTLLDLLRGAAAERPDAPALYFKGASLSWSRLHDLSSQFAAGLIAEGVRPGDRVALLLPNCPQFLIAELGTWKAGGVVVALNPIYTDRELAQPLRESDATLLVALTKFYDRARAVQPHTKVRRVIATSIKDYFPAHLSLLFTVFRERKDGHRIRLAPGDIWFTDVLSRGRAKPQPAVDVGLDDPAVLLGSGGTTGTPKCVVGTHRAYGQAGRQLRRWTESLCGEWTDSILLPLPLFHVYANVGVQAMAFVGRNPIALVPNPRDIADLLATIRKVRPVFLTAVPTLLIALLSHEDVQAGRADLSSIRICFSGAAALMGETRRQFEPLIGGKIIEGYSLTEGMMACLANPLLGTSKIGSIGIPLPDVDVRIVDTDDPTIAMAAGQLGELLLSAPQLMAGYWKNESETSAALRRDRDGKLWLHTGDIGYQDEDGYVFLVDRKKDLIKTSGFQVWPREVEEALTSHPAVAEAGVAGVPDPVKGEAVQAWIVVRHGERTTEDDLRRWCRERLAPYKVPTRVEFRAELPKSMVGKVLRRALAATDVTAPQT